MAKFRNVTVAGYHLLFVEVDGRMIFLHPMGRVGECLSPGSNLRLRRDGRAGKLQG